MTISYGLVLGGFAALAVTTMMRLGAARRRLDALDPRAPANAGPDMTKKRP